ncbi:N-acetylmuramoyl-L-alanine amidase [Clostridium tarantellae]|uniref:SPOR domain-containing protein n=1 Tax=Clostridium tarantellae TaxID=39493 RepID=A0A6I1MS96_9CLOT|nr:N-acetylmuramoyl-L-alanine amidase [Clostridium tarantellae]MPQ45067.1 hypothetical protein [Clostridium tarantellae]
MSKKVFIGVGHGGSDAGAVYGKLKEKDMVLPIALEVKKILKEHGSTVKLSREKDENDTIQQEVAEERYFNSDLAIDIHINAGGGDGFEVFHHHLGGRSKILAENIEKEVISLGQNSRGCKIRMNSNGTADYYMFIRETKGSAVIVECAFIDTKDIKCVDELNEQKDFGKAIAKGALKTLNIEYKGEENGNYFPGNDSSNNIGDNSNSGNGFFRVIVGSFKDKNNALTLEKDLKNEKIDVFLIYENGFYKVVAGSFKERENAENKLNYLKNLGYKAFLSYYQV